MEPTTPSESHLICAGCGYNLTGVAVGTRCPECGVAVEDSIAAYGQSGRRRTPLAERCGYTAPVLVTIFCFITGIGAVVYTAKANTAAALGDATAFQKALKSRRAWLIASMVIGAIVIGLQVAFAIGG